MVATPYKTNCNNLSLNLQQVYNAGNRPDWEMNSSPHLVAWFACMLFLVQAP